MLPDPQVESISINTRIPFQSTILRNYNQKLESGIKHFHHFPRPIEHQINEHPPTMSHWLIGPPPHKERRSSKKSPSIVDTSASISSTTHQTNNSTFYDTNSSHDSSSIMTEKEKANASWREDAPQQQPRHQEQKQKKESKSLSLSKLLNKSKGGSIR